MINGLADGAEAAATRPVEKDQQFASQGLGHKDPARRFYEEAEWSGVRPYAFLDPTLATVYLASCLKPNLLLPCLIPVLLAPTAALSQERPVATRIEYSVSKGCPTEVDFLDKVRSRNNHFVVSQEPGAITIRTQFELTSEGSVKGTALFVLADGASSSREVSGATCQEVADALAVVVAIMLDPDNATTHAALPPPPAAPPAAPTPKPLRPPVPMRWVPGLAAGLGVASTFGPWPAWYGELSFELRASALGWWAPVTRLGVDYGARGDVQGQEGTAAFRWAGGHAEGCPSQIALLSSVSIEPCLRFETGPMHGSGQTPEGSRSKWTPWAAAGALARARLAITDRLSLNVSGGAVLPLARNRFFLNTRELTVYQPPAVGARVGIDLTFHFL